MTDRSKLLAKQMSEVADRMQSRLSDYSRSDSTYDQMMRSLDQTAKWATIYLALRAQAEALS